MNRSILIVICDFLLLSLLTFSTDINHIATDDTSRSAAHVNVTTNAVVTPGSDLNDMMKQALASERQSHEQLQQQLAAARSNQGQQQAVLEQTRQQNAALQAQYASAQTNISNLNREM